MKKSNKKCLNCDNFVSLKKNKFCSPDCYGKYKTIRKYKTCLLCDRPTHNKQYCSKECKDKILNVSLNCKGCGKEFLFHKNRFDLDVSDGRYCSNICRARLIPLDENYFDFITDEKIILLGKIIVCGWHSDFRTLHVISDFSTLSDINIELSSGYSIKRSMGKLGHLIITSERLVSKLISLGLCDNPMYQELPFYDFDLLLIGIRNTHVFEIVNGREVFKFRSSRISMEISDRLGMRIVERFFKDMSIGRTAVEYIVY